jgi:hypothetical protein
MVFNLARGRNVLGALLLACAWNLVPAAYATSCATQSQMTPAERETFSRTAETILSDVQTGNVDNIRGISVPAVAADFKGMSDSVAHLRPLVQTATITVDNLYVLDATGNPHGETRTDFYCGSPVVVWSFPIPSPGMYAVAIVHATGVQHPQQVTIILSKTPDNRWLVAGMVDRAMTAAGHDGLWYWVSARKYAQTKMDWDAWFYYRLATTLLDPLDSLSSPNLTKLHQEADQIHPQDLPGTVPMTFYADGELIAVSAVDTTTALGGLDLDVHYKPDATQAAQLHDPAGARKQVTSVMSGLLKMHPELQRAFHGIWVHADQGTGSLFALELPMDQIATGAPQVSVFPNQNSH